jgi:hypothetical protein
MSRRRRFEPGELENARRLYVETGTPVAEIAATLSLTPRSLAARISGWGWPSRTRRTQAGDQGGGTPPLTAEDRRAGVVSRVRTTVEREIAQIEDSLARMEPLGSPGGDPEKLARTLASLVKTLNELQRLDASAGGAAAKEPDDAMDIDEFRRELARRLDALCESGPDDGGAGGSER